MIINIILFFMFIVLCVITYFSYSIYSSIDNIGNEKEINECQTRCGINLNEINDAKNLLSIAKIIATLLLIFGILSIIIMVMRTKPKVLEKKQQKPKTGEKLELSYQNILSMQHLLQSPASASPSPPSLTTSIPSGSGISVGSSASPLGGSGLHRSLNIIR